MKSISDNREKILVWEQLAKVVPRQIFATYSLLLISSAFCCSQLCLESLILITAVSGVGSSPTLATCETSQVLLASVPGVFSRGSPIFPPTD